jgi:hypothetical protein
MKATPAYTERYLLEGVVTRANSGWPTPRSKWVDWRYDAGHRVPSCPDTA